MSRSIVTMPRVLMRRASSFEWDLEFRTRSAGPGNDDSEQIVGQGPARFVGSCQLTLTRDTVAQYRAVRAAMQGRRNAIRVPMVDRRGWAQFGAGPTFSGGETFSEGETFAYAPMCKALATASAGAAHIDVDWLDNTVPPKAGMFISYHDWPALVTAAIPLSGFAATWRLTVERLAVTIPAGGLIDLRARGLFLLTEDTAGALSYGPVGAATPRLSLVEWITR